MDELKNTANERETRVSTVLRDESPKKIIEKDASPAPITPIPTHQILRFLLFLFLQPQKWSKKSLTMEDQTLQHPAFL